MNIPPEALEAGAKVLTDYGITAATDADLARAAFEAMIGAWPGMVVRPEWQVTKTLYQPAEIILPLTEASDAEA